jgi:hypothetical protein
VGANDGLANSQPKPMTICSRPIGRLAAEEWLENALAIANSNACSVIID